MTRGCRAEVRRVEGASTLGGVGYSQKVRKLEGNCFPSSLNSIIRYFRPVKAHIAKVIRPSLSLCPSYRRFRVRKWRLKCVIMDIILNSNRGNSTLSPPLLR